MKAILLFLTHTWFLAHSQLTPRAADPGVFPEEASPSPHPARPAELPEVFPEYLAHGFSLGRHHLAYAPVSSPWMTAHLLAQPPASTLAPRSNPLSTQQPE